MGIAASGLNQPATKSQTAIWISFPAHALTGADWTDHGSAHRAIMRLFPQTLPGEANRRRAGSKILYRVDIQEGIPTVLVQTQTPPELLPAEARAMTVPGQAWHQPAGTRVRFRAALNPVQRHGNQTRPIPAKDALEWARARLAPALGDIDIANDTFSSTTTRHRTTPRIPGTVNILTVDGFATVNDTALWDEHRRDGLGRARAYGAGLITSQPID